MLSQNPVSIRAAQMQRVSQHGFALVLALSLMAFVLVLLLSISTLVQVESRSASITIDQLKARQNALLGAYIAVGNLQKAAGPDQRVTARAEILDTDATTETVEGVAQPMWTGVWESPKLADGTNRDSDRELDAGANLRADVPAPTWLVSTPRSFAPNSAETDLANLTALYPTSATERATLLEYTDSSGAAAQVEVPLIEIQAGSDSGSYAYWVADEGVKAKLNLADPNRLNDFASGGTPQDLSQNQLHFLSPSRFAVDRVLADSTDQDTYLALSHAELSRLFDAGSLQIILGNDYDTAATGWMRNQMALTPYSYGVLADVRTGGLRTDLTAALEDATQFNELLSADPSTGTDYLGGKLWQVLDSDVPVTHGLQLNGLRWHSFFLYYNLYKAQMPNPRTGAVDPDAPEGTGGLVANAEIEPRVHLFDSNGGTGGSANQVSIDAIHAHLAGYQIKTTLTAELVGADEYQPQFYVYPRFALYNSFSVGLKSYATTPAADGFYYSYGGNFFGAGSPNLRIFRTNVAVTNSNHALYSLTGAHGTLKETFLQTAPAESSFDAGQLIVFGTDQTGSSLVPGNLGGFYRVDAGTFLGNSFTARPLVASNWATGNRLKGFYPKFYPKTNSDDFGQDTPADTTDDHLRGGDRINLLIQTTSNSNSVSFTLYNINRWPDQPRGNYTSHTIAPEEGASTGGNDNSQSLFPRPNGDLITSGHGGAAGLDFTNPGWARYGFDSGILVSTLVGSETDAVNLTTRLKGIIPDDPRSTLPTFGMTGAFLNPLNPYSSEKLNDLQFRATVDTDETKHLDANISGTDPVTAGWGKYDVAIDSSSATEVFPLKEVPLQPLVSLGQFMHMLPRYRATDGSDNSFRQEDQQFSLYPLGGSHMHPLLSSRTSVAEMMDWYWKTGDPGFDKYTETLRYDDVWLTNDALFDRYFLSTVPSAALAPGTIYPTAWQNFDQAAIDDQSPLLNPRMTLLHDASGAPLLADLQDKDTAAAHLLVNGAFNINSTSVDAWKAQLGSLRYEASPETTRFLRLTSVFSDIPGDTTQDAKKGSKLFTADQTTRLAQLIVEQIKTRGLALSLADFINRRLVTSELGLMGPLQAAIEQFYAETAASDIDSHPDNYGTALNVDVARRFADDKNDVTNAYLLEQQMEAGLAAGNFPTSSAQGAPMVLNQRDLIQALAPNLSARSDTFVVRAYGEAAAGFNANKSASAICELVVQRVPSYVDENLDAAETSPTAGSVNDRFGRSFRIVSMRWDTLN